MLRRPRGLRATSALTSVAILAGCAVDPPPAPQSTQSSQSAAPAPRAAQIIMAIDSIGPGFNPHLLSDQSPVTAAVSALVLPSSFRPVPDPTTPTGSRWEQDPDLLVSAAVTSAEPFTVTYKIRPEAAWTDNAPIAADDFWYQWRQMVSQPGVVDPAGYDLVTGVQSVDGGKTAVVTFSQPYPAWRELFNDLLPAHIVKDIPGGFTAGLARTMAVTGGQFRVETIDPQRDEILLARNDRFWGAPARPDQILFRRGGAPAALADSIRNGDTQVAQVHGGAAAFAQLSAIPDVRTGRLITPRVLQLILRAKQPKLADPMVREALLGLLDVDLLAAVAAGSDNSVTLDQSLVRTPSDPGYVATAPAPPGREGALELFGRAGYQVDRNAPESTVPNPLDGASATRAPETTRGRISRDGKTLSLVIGAAANDPTSVAVANTAADQLRSVGIAATVLALEPTVLYGSALVNNRVDAIVGWHAAGGDLATALAARYGCPAVAAAPLSTAPVPPPPGRPTETPGPETSGERPPTQAASPEPTPLVRAPSNLTGICDPTIQPKIDGALDGSLDVEAVIDAVEPRLWALSAVLPIIQDTTIVAIGPTVKNVSLTGAVPVGIVGDAGKWVKVAP
ncbi:ABC transporter family substrate-binding protein [Mycolicibacterium sp.]|uniref:ABC transporter family substrate-binding protein n=1 Tax=Mycolicibacterium sp. TaxID=2320850 RepID=UPI0025EC5E72|nr:ABC transporter family substrate-binding protein [Mycolicibacterium sp.]